MRGTESEERRSDLKTKVIDQLHDPVRLRVCVLASILAIGYFAVYTPLQERISDLTKNLDRDRKKLALAARNDKLQAEYVVFNDRIPKVTDNKEWVQFMLDGIRKFPLRLTKLNCQDSKHVGPYRAVVMNIELEGRFFDMDAFIRWVELNERLLRIDEISMAPSHSGEDQTVLRLTVLGLTS